MSSRWKVAGLVLAGIAFVAVLLDPGRFLAVPPVFEAAAAAIVVFIAVWLYEAIFIAIRWVWRQLAR